MSSSLDFAFASLDLSDDLLQVVDELGYKSMTPIQAQTIPLLLQGKDLIGQSKTGSGKTAAFSIPILERIDLRRRQVQAMVLCPTRELCAQVTREIRKLGRRHPGLQVISLSGGEPLRMQAYALEKGVHIVVGTPGRVMDHMRRDILNLRSIKTVVLDEADRMLDMGFQEDMETILTECPVRRQTVLFSATFPDSIESMSEAYQTKPERVTIADTGQSTSTIRQLLYNVAHDGKIKALLSLLQEHAPESVVIFCNQKITTAAVAHTLIEAGLSAAGLHGDLEQFDRDKVMAKFRNRSVRALVATDVAARGIDVENVAMVVNYDLPIKEETYVHRIGRTGRAGKAGLAISLATGREAAKVERLEALTRTKMERARIAAGSGDEAPKKILTDAAQMTTVRIGAGRKDKLRPGDVLGALTGEAGGLAAALVGKIEIHDRFTYVAIASDVAKVAVQRLLDGRIKGRKLNVEIVK